MPFMFVWFAGSHLWWLLPMTLFIVFLIIVVQRMAWSRMSTGNQQVDYAPYQPHVQEDAQRYYQPYQQGYRTQEPSQSPERVYETPAERAQEGSYQPYDQPIAEYPQQMPPM